MRLKVSHRRICPAPSQLCDDLRSKLNNIDWASEQYNRFEPSLTAGKLLEMPYRISTQNILDPVDPITVSIQCLVDWMLTRPRLVDFEPVRGEIATLNPSAELDLHRDRRWFHANSRRMHIPLITNENCVHVGVINEQAETYHMDVDYLYELNNIDLHKASNAGTVPRIHLIVDFMPAGFLEERKVSGVKIHARVKPGIWPEWIDK